LTIYELTDLLRIGRRLGAVAYVPALLLAVSCDWLKMAGFLYDMADFHDEVGV
jgi:hypothetical protein